MAKPVSWTPDQSGAAQVQFDDGSSHLLPPQDPNVRRLLANLPTADALSQAIANEPSDARLARNDVDYIAPEKAPPAPAPTVTDAAPAAPAVTRDPDDWSGGPNPGKPASLNAPVTPTIPAGERTGLRPQAEKPADYREAVDKMMPWIPGTPGRLIPGKRAPQSWTTQQEAGLELPDTIVEKYNTASDLSLAAAEKESQAALDDQRIRQEAAEQDKAWRWQQDQKRAERESARDEQAKQAQAAFDAAKNIDPERVWNSKTNWEKFVSKLQIAGHDFVDTWLRRGGDNQALKQLNMEIERDVQGQLQNLNRASHEMQQMYGQWDREDARQMAGEKAHYESSARQLEEWLAPVRNEQTKAAGMKLVATLNDQAADRGAKLAQLTQGKQVTTQHDVQTKDQVVGGSPARRNIQPMIQAYIGSSGKPAAQAMKELQEAASAYKSLNPGMTMDNATAAVLGASANQWLAPKPTGGSQGGADPNWDEQKLGQAERYSKRLEDAKVPTYYSIANDLRSLAAGQKPGDRIEGMGLLERNVPAWTPLVGASEEGKRNQMLMANLIDMLGRARSGGAIQAEEDKRFTKILRGEGTPEDMQWGATMMETIGQRMARLQASGFKPEVVEHVNETSGIKRVVPVTVDKDGKPNSK